MSGISYSAEAAQTLVAIYSTPDVVAQREATTRRLALKPGEQVIDIGCGPGFLCESMAADVGATGRVLGVELSEDLVRFATGRKSRPWIDYHPGDAAKLDVPTASFDVVVSTQVVEYVPDADAALREMYRAVRPGGRVWRDNLDESSYCLSQLCSRGFSLIFASSVVMPRITQFSIPAWAARGDARRRRQGWPSL